MSWAQIAHTCTEIFFTENRYICGSRFVKYSRFVVNSKQGFGLVSFPKKSLELCVPLS